MHGYRALRKMNTDYFSVANRNPQRNLSDYVMPYDRNRVKLVIQGTVCNINPSSNIFNITKAIPQLQKHLDNKTIDKKL